MTEYKGYTGKVEFDSDARLLHGEVVGIRDVVTFQGRSVAELEKAFRESVDDYLDFCRKRGESPDKPASGRFIVRVDPRLHRRMNVLAAAAGKSLNTWIAETLQREAGPAARRVRKTTGRKGKASAKASTPDSALEIFPRDYLSFDIRHLTEEEFDALQDDLHAAGIKILDDHEGSSDSLVVSCKNPKAARKIFRKYRC